MIFCRYLRYIYMNKLLIVFLVLLLVDILVPIITGFLSISVESYINYLMWFNALGLFYAILPERTGLMFIKN
jgi:hypothetical protein